MTTKTVKFIDGFFECDLDLSLTLSAEGQKVDVVSGHIERLSLDLHSYGFSGSIQVSSFGEDQLDALLQSTKVTKFTLTFQPTDPAVGGAPLFELQGIVTRKLFKRVDAIGENKEQPIRLYEIAFLDAAQAIWSEHFPINIYVDESMKEILEKHKNGDIKIKYDFAALEVKHPITAFSLGYQDTLPDTQQVSFYSFLMWYLHQEGGMLVYDYVKHSYSILEKKEPPQGEPYALHEWWVAAPLVAFPHPKRYQKKIIKHTSDSIDAQDKDHPDAFKTVRRDDIHAYNYRTFPEQAHEIVHSSTRAEHPLLEVEVGQFVDDFHINKIYPGFFVSFAGGDFDTWCEDPLYKNQVFRVRSLLFEASKLSQSEVVKKTVQPYRIYAKNILESKDEKYIETILFNTPHFPFSIQGSVVSDIGDKEQSTYKIAEKEQAPQGQYLVSVPLASKSLVVPFTPDFMSGQYYFPFCKGEKVLLSVYFRTAKIERIIDWQPLARLPSGVQGNQIVFSSNGKDKYAFLKHEFEDGKNSVITLQQATSETQLQIIQIRDKDILITVDEQEKKTLFIQLNIDQGLTISLEDKMAQMIQETVFDGKTMTHTCKDSGSTSTLVQKPDSITVTCKEFTVSSDKIVLSAKDSIEQSGQSKVDIETPIANIKASTVKLG